MAASLEKRGQNRDNRGDGSDQRSGDQQVGVFRDHHGSQMLGTIADGAEQCQFFSPLHDVSQKHCAEAERAEQ